MDRKLIYGLVSMVVSFLVTLSLISLAECDPVFPQEVASIEIE